jgi:hypothetical protein
MACRAHSCAVFADHLQATSPSADASSGVRKGVRQPAQPCDDLLHFGHPGLSCKALPTWSFWVKGDAVRGGDKPDFPITTFVASMTE